MRVFILTLFLVGCNSRIEGYKIEGALTQCKAHGGIGTLVAHANDTAEVTCADGTHYMHSTDDPK